MNISTFISSLTPASAYHHPPPSTHNYYSHTKDPGLGHLTTNDSQEDSPK